MAAAAGAQEAGGEWKGRGPGPWESGWERVVALTGLKAVTELRGYRTVM